MKQERRTDVIFSGKDVELYEELKNRAAIDGSTIQDQIKKLLK